MDNELKDMLVKILEGQSKLETEVTGLKEEVKRNSIKLEIIEKNINIIAEVQTAHKEQNETSLKNTSAIIEEKTDLIETAVKSISKDVIQVKESVDVMKDVIGRHQIDIEILKRRPV